MKKLLGSLLQTIGALTLLLALGLAVSLYWAGQWLQVDDGPNQADYILALAGDSSRDIHAAELFRQGFAPALLVSHGWERPATEVDRLNARLGYPQYENFEHEHRQIYAQLGVPSQALEFFGNGHVSTVEEAEALRAHLKGRPVRLLLVTSPYHARRAKTIFQDIYPEATVRMVITPHESFRESWWTDQHSAQMVVLETAKILHYLLGGAFRSTDERL
ncbi:MAG: YdcF family protein [Desulfovibrionaceae bacterium]